MPVASFFEMTLRGPEFSEPQGALGFRLAFDAAFYSYGASIH